MIWRRQYGVADVDESDGVLVVTESGFDLATSRDHGCWLVELDDAGEAVWSRTYWDHKKRYRPRDLLVVEEGDMAGPGTNLVKLEQKDRMKVVASVGEKDVNRLRAGDRVTVTVTSLPDANYEVQSVALEALGKPHDRIFHRP